MTQIYASLVRDVTQCYEKEPSLAMGLQFGFTVRNHSDHQIVVTHRAGFSQAIDPESGRFSPEGWRHDCERDSVWLDIHYAASNLNNCRKNPDVTGNAVDEAICYAIANHIKVTPAHGRGMSTYRCHVGICLSELKPNYGASTWYSEMLGIFIDLDSSTVRPDYLSKEEYQAVTDIQPLHDNTTSSVTDDTPTEAPVDYTQPIRMVKTGNTTYQHIMYVDNTEQCSPVWLWLEGEPTVIRPHINHRLASGLYFFTSGSKRHRFLSANHITDEALLQRGMAFSQQELLKQPRMKAFHELKKSHDVIIKQLEQITEEKKIQAEKSQQHATALTDQHQQTLKKAEQRYQDTLTTLQHQHQKTTQTLEKDNDTLRERLRNEQHKNQENSIKHLEKVRDLKEEIRQHKQKAEDSMKKRFAPPGTCLSVIGAVIDILKKLSSIPKLGFLS